jgi:hypothetical protein
VQLTAAAVPHISQSRISVSTSRSTNNSRAYWELKAEQVMDRVFGSAGVLEASPQRTARPQPQPPAQEPIQEPIEVVVRETAPVVRRPWRIGDVDVPPHLAFTMTAVVALMTFGVVANLWHGWNEARQDLRQERNLRLLEGVRNLGGSAVDHQPSNATTTTNGDGLPPPPPNEPWIEELGQLEARSSGAVAPLQVPVNGTLLAPAPPASLAATPAEGSTPELLGVVQIPGKPGSAIFQIGGSSTNALVGENIGSSGWRLIATSGDSAVIERGGVSRRVSIGSGF